MKLQIRHLTRYRYARPVRGVMQTLCLTPRSHEGQTVLRWSVRAPAALTPQVDAWGNMSHLLRVESGERVVACEATGLVRTTGRSELTDPHGPDPRFYLNASPLAQAHGPIGALAREVLGPVAQEGPTAGRVLELAWRVAERVRYRAGVTDAGTTAEAAWEGGEGVCQDQAHVFVAACRAAGLPARYVSGYFHAEGAPELASHAWAQVCLDRSARRWLAVDVTHACLTDLRHVQLAVGPDYAGCPPVRGVRSGGGGERLTVVVEVAPVTAPESETA